VEISTQATQNLWAHAPLPFSKVSYCKISDVGLTTHPVLHVYHTATFFIMKTNHPFRIKGQIRTVPDLHALIT